MLLEFSLLTLLLFASVTTFVAVNWTREDNQIPKKQIQITPQRNKEKILKKTQDVVQKVIKDFPLQEDELFQFQNPIKQNISLPQKGQKIDKGGKADDEGKKRNMQQSLLLNERFHLLETPEIKRRASNKVDDQRKVNQPSAHMTPIFPSIRDEFEEKGQQSKGFAGEQCYKKIKTNENSISKSLQSALEIEETNYLMRNNIQREKDSIGKQSFTVQSNQLFSETLRKKIDQYRQSKEIGNGNPLSPSKDIVEEQIVQEFQSPQKHIEQLEKDIKNVEQSIIQENKENDEQQMQMETNIQGNDNTQINDAENKSDKKITQEPLGPFQPSEPLQPSPQKIVAETQEPEKDAQAAAEVNLIEPTQQNPQGLQIFKLFSFQPQSTPTTQQLGQGALGTWSVKNFQSVENNDNSQSLFNFNQKGNSSESSLFANLIKQTSVKPQEPSISNDDMSEDDQYTNFKAKNVKRQEPQTTQSSSNPISNTESKLISNLFGQQGGLFSNSINPSNQLITNQGEKKPLGLFNNLLTNSNKDVQFQGLFPKNSLFNQKTE